MGIPDQLDLAFKSAELFALVFGGGALFYRIGRMTMKFEAIGNRQAEEIKELKIAMKELITSNSRIDRLEERTLAEGQRLDEAIAMMHRLLFDKIMESKTNFHSRRDQSDPSSA